ncbi:MAG TPA: hypothetical protein VMV10_14270 [Pirellulales bacterium]|nr:hypothetical protein [Pirellulales bacterium]
MSVVKLTVVQFSLRSLFVALTVIAIGVGSWTNSARRQQEVVTIVERQGGVVGYDRNQPLIPRLWSIVETVLGKDYVRSVAWVQMPMLMPGESALGKPRLPAVSRLSKLKKLYLNGTSTTDCDLAEIGRCASLIELHIADTGITDAGIHHLQGLKKLTVLDLSGAAVSNAAAPNLMRLRSVHSMVLDRTKFDDDGIRQLRRALGDCIIQHRAFGL